jgi:putative DNA primase/helicase
MAREQKVTPIGEKKFKDRFLWDLELLQLFEKIPQKLTGFALRDALTPDILPAIAKRTLREAGQIATYLEELEKYVGHLGSDMKFGLNQQIRDLHRQARLEQSQKRAAAGSKKKQADDAGALNHNCTEFGNAERFFELNRGNLRYCREWHSWLCWTGICWEKSWDRPQELAKSMVRSIYREAADCEDPDFRDELLRHARKSETAARIDAALKLATSTPGVPVKSEHLDADPYLLNVNNGTVNLQTGKISDHDKAQLLTKVAPVKFDPDADCPQWRAFLNTIFAGNQDVIDFMQNALGYSITGDVRERCLFILHGMGANGKSTLLDVVSYVLGQDYATKTPTETLLAKPVGSIPNDVARLKGLRFVTASEADEGRRLDEARIKDLTGNEAITARFMRAEFFTFMPQFKLWLATNHKPVITGTDKAIWDRIRLIPFDVRIPEDQQDKGLADRLKAESSGILNWLLEGCRHWTSHGLTSPKEVMGAVNDYQAEMDVVGRFLDEKCRKVKAHRVQCGGLYAALKDWLEVNGEGRMSQKQFSTRMLEKGFEKSNVSGGKQYWLDIAMVQPEPEAELAPL